MHYIVFDLALCYTDLDCDISWEHNDTYIIITCVDRGIVNPHLGGHHSISRRGGGRGLGYFGNE